MNDISTKNGLYYRDNFHTLVGIDIDSNVFTGRVPFGVHTIDDNVFANTSFESYSIPDSVKHIGFNLFENCTNARTIRLPGGLSELTPYLFSGCKNLSKVNMPNVVTEFPEGIFMNCTSLTEVPFRTDIGCIGAKAFLGCSSLTNVVFPETVQVIEHQAFALCTGIESIVIGSSVSEIADDAFAGCTGLCHIRLADDNQYFSLNGEGSVVRKSDGKVVIAIASSQKTDVVFKTQDQTAEIPDEKLAVWAGSEEDDSEDDDTFSAEIGAGDEEALSMGATPEVIESSVEPVVSEIKETPKDMYSDIMNQNDYLKEEEKKQEPVSVGISIEELSSVVDTMNASNGQYTEDAAEKKLQDRNLNILCQNVGYSLVQEIPSTGLPSTTPELYVFAELLVTGEDGKKSISPKLKKCCETLAKIHDLKKVIYLAELPVDNDEFIMFLENTVKRQHVLVACEAANPDNLSEYCRKICSATQISMEKSEIIEQRKRAGIKNPGMIKLIVQDKI